MSLENQALSLTGKFASLGNSYSQPVTFKPLKGQELLLWNNVHDLASLPTSPWTAKAVDDLLDGNTGVAQVYAGHQFGNFVPQLGDGRGMLLGEYEGLDIGLKGSGITPYSRGFDGRANLRSSLREFYCSAYMQAIGIKSSGALALWSGEETVVRDLGEEITGLVMRTASSHVRFGTFEYFAHSNQPDKVEALAHWCMKQYSDSDNLTDWLKQVVEQTAELIASWQCYGFCHGVMNTDNMSIVGETIDYGPYSFLDTYDHEFVCNLSDYQGRYKFSSQPEIGRWNCQQLLSCFAKLLPAESLRDIDSCYNTAFSQAFYPGLSRRLEIATDTLQQGEMVGRWLGLLQKFKIDYHNFFIWKQLPSDEKPAWNHLLAEHDQVDDFITELSALDSALVTDSDTKASAKYNPAFLLRNGLLQEAIGAYYNDKNLDTLKALQQACADPFASDTIPQAWLLPPKARWQGFRLSCSA